MEKFQAFLEMPMGYYGHDDFMFPPVPFKNKNTSFRQFNTLDRAVIVNGTVGKKLEQILNKTPWTWNILFIEHPIEELLVGDKVKKVFKDGKQLTLVQRAEIFMQQNSIPKQGRITFVKNGSTGHILTPWMTLHVIGHAVFAEDENGNSYGKNKILDLVSKMIRSYFLRIGTKSLVTDLQKFFVFKSIFKDNIVTQDELVYELVAEFLWNGGKIRLSDKYKNEERTIYYVKQIEQTITETLNTLVGTIIEDAFYD